MISIPSSAARFFRGRDIPDNIAAPNCELLSFRESPERLIIWTSGQLKVRQINTAYVLASKVESHCECFEVQESIARCREKNKIVTISRYESTL